jgi:hypothetical protein
MVSTLVKNLLLTGGLAILPASAADLTGDWHITGEISGNALDSKCGFKQDTAKLTGVCKTAEGAEHPFAGEVKEESVVFHYDVDYQGTTYTLTYTGKLESETAMKGDVEAGGASGTFTAKKE